MKKDIRNKKGGIYYVFTRELYTTYPQPVDKLKIEELDKMKILDRAPVFDSEPPSVTTVVSSNQVNLRHTKVQPYCCSFPGLTGFGSFCCEGPSSQRHLLQADLKSQNLRQEFSPAVADCRYRAPLVPHLARPKIS